MTLEQKLSMLYQSEHSQYLCPRKDIPTQREQRGTEGTNNWGKRLVIFNQEHKLRALAANIYVLNHSGYHRTPLLKAALETSNHEGLEDLSFREESI